MPIGTIGLFEGIGGFIRAAESVGGFEWIESVEINPDAQRVLRSHYTHPIHSDIRDYHPQCGAADCIVGGFPCHGTSAAGSRRGLDDENSSLWWEMLRVVREVRPQFLVIENPEGLRHRGLNLIINSLTQIGYVGSWQCLSAAQLGACHVRQRIFIVSHPHSLRFCSRPACWSDQVRHLVSAERASELFPVLIRTDAGITVRLPAGLDGYPIGVPARVPGRIKSRYLFGRSVVPACAAIALRRVKYLHSLL